MATALLVPEFTLVFVKGESRTLDIIITDGDDKPIDITGATVIFTVKADFDDQFPLIRKTTANVSEGVITAPRAGKARIFVTPADTFNLDTDFDYMYDVWVILSTTARHAVIPPSVFRVTDSVARIPLS